MPIKEEANMLLVEMLDVVEEAVVEGEVAAMLVGVEVEEEEAEILPYKQVTIPLSNGNNSVMMNVIVY